MSPLTALGVCMFAIVLLLRVRAFQARPVPSTWSARWKLAKVLWVALLAFAAIAMRLSWTIKDLDAKPRQPMSWWQQLLNEY